MSDTVDFTESQLNALREKSKEDSDAGAVVRAFLETLDSDDGNDETIPQPPDGYVYVAEAEDGVVKIGKSKNPQKRLRSLSTGSAYDLTLLVKKEVANSSSKESKIQLQFDDHRMRGEWFDASDGVKAKIIEAVESLDRYD